MTRPSRTIRIHGCAITVERSGGLWCGRATSRDLGLRVVALHRRRSHLLHEVAAALGVTQRREDYWVGMAAMVVTRLDPPATARG